MCYEVEHFIVFLLHVSHNLTLLQCNLLSERVRTINLSSALLEKDYEKYQRDSWRWSAICLGNSYLPLSSLQLTMLASMAPMSSDAQFSWSLILPKKYTFKKVKGLHLFPLSNIHLFHFPVIVLVGYLEVILTYHCLNAFSHVSDYSSSFHLTKLPLPPGISGSKAKLILQFTTHKGNCSSNP